MRSCVLSVGGKRVATVSPVGHVDNLICDVNILMMICSRSFVTLMLFRVFSRKLGICDRVELFKTYFTIMHA